MKKNRLKELEIIPERRTKKHVARIIGTIDIIIEKDIGENGDE